MLSRTSNNLVDYDYLIRLFIDKNVAEIENFFQVHKDNIDLNYVIKIGETRAPLLFHLIRHPLLYLLLMKNPDRWLTAENMQMTAVEGLDRDITILWLLAANSKLRPLLLSRPDLLTAENVQMGPREGPDKGKIALWYLAAMPELRPLLLSRPDLLTVENVQIGPVEGQDKDLTVIWLLVFYPQLHPLLLNQPDLLTAENIQMGPREGFYKGTVLFALVNAPALQPLIIQRPELLTASFIDQSLLASLKIWPETRFLAEACEQALLYFETEQWIALTKLLKSSPWLIQLRMDILQNTLLHGLVKKLDDYPENRLLHFLETQKELIALLKTVSLLQNVNEETADCWAKNLIVRNTVRAPVSSYQKQLEYLLLDNVKNFHFIADLLGQQYALKNDIITLTTPTRKIQFSTMDQFIPFLGEQINLIGSFTELLTNTALLKVQALIEQGNDYNATFSLKIACKLLTAKEIFLLEQLVSLLACLNHEASPHNKLESKTKKRSREESVEVDGSSNKRLKNTVITQFFPSSNRQPRDPVLPSEANPLYRK